MWQNKQSSLPMKQQIDPKETSRARAFELWMASPMPMVTITKTFDISRLVRYGKRHGLQINMLLCHCIGMAAQQQEEFYLLPAKDAFYKYDRIAINVIVKGLDGQIHSCDIPMSDDLQQFNEAYQKLTKQVTESSKSYFLDDYMIIGTSTLVESEIDSITNQYSEQFQNPFLAWGRYRKRCFRYTLPISFQFHHVQMDGLHAARFLEQLQQRIKHHA